MACETGGQGLAECTQLALVAKQTSQKAKSCLVPESMCLHRLSFKMNEAFTNSIAFFYSNSFASDHLDLEARKTSKKQLIMFY